MAPQIIDSTNVFLDSSTHRSGNGLEFTVQSPGYFTAKDDEFLRVTLQSLTCLLYTSDAADE